MRINNQDISVWCARQSTMQFAPSKFSNASVWKTGAAVPTIFGGKAGFKTLTLRLIVKGNDREDILHNVSAIVGACADKCEIGLDRYDNGFTGYLTSASNEELAKKLFHRLTLQFTGYEHGDLSQTTGTTSVRVYNHGSLPSPARLILTPTSDISRIVLTGICRDSYTGEDLPVTIEDVTSGSTIILDGIDGAITESGQPKDADIWRLPSLMPGWTTITCDNSHVGIAVQYLPLYA